MSINIRGRIHTNCQMNIYSEFCVTTKIKNIHMNQMKRLAIIFSGAFLLSSFSAFSQTEAENETQDNNLRTDYRRLIENTETFKQYKVVPITDLNSFEKKLADTLSRYKNEIVVAEREEREAKKTADSLRSEVQELKANLEETQKMVDGILFLGMPMTKSGYNALVWSIVAILLIGLGVVYFLYYNSNKVTKQTKIDKARVDNELEELRKTSHEKQVKIKRELQTALNKLEEHNR